MILIRELLIKIFLYQNKITTINFANNSLRLNRKLTPLKSDGFIRKRIKHYYSGLYDIEKYKM